MTKPHVLTEGEQDALLIHIYALAMRAADKVVRSRFRDDIVMDFMVYCLEALRAGTFAADLDDLETFVTACLRRLTKNVKRRDRAERLADIAYWQTRVDVPQRWMSHATRNAARRNAIRLFAIDRRTIGKVEPTDQSPLPTPDIGHPPSPLARRKARNAKGHTRWRRRRRERRDAAGKGSRGPVESGTGRPESGTGRPEGGTGRPEGGDGITRDATGRPEGGDGPS